MALVEVFLDQHFLLSAAGVDPREGLEGHYARLGRTMQIGTGEYFRQQVRDVIAAHQALDERKRELDARERELDAAKVASVSVASVQVQQGQPTRSRSRSPVERPGVSCSSPPRSRRCPTRRAPTRSRSRSPLSPVRAASPEAPRSRGSPMRRAPSPRWSSPSPPSRRSPTRFAPRRPWRSPSPHDSQDAHNLGFDQDDPHPGCSPGGLSPGCLERMEHTARIIRMLARKPPCSRSRAFSPGSPDRSRSRSPVLNRDPRQRDYTRRRPSRYVDLMLDTVPLKGSASGQGPYVSAIPVEKPLLTTSGDPILAGSFVNRDDTSGDAPVCSSPKPQDSDLPWLPSPPHQPETTTSARPRSKRMHRIRQYRHKRTFYLMGKDSDDSLDFDAIHHEHPDFYHHSESSSDSSPDRLSDISSVDSDYKFQPQKDPLTLNTSQSPIQHIEEGMAHLHARQEFRWREDSYDIHSPTHPPFSATCRPQGTSSPVSPRVPLLGREPSPLRPDPGYSSSSSEG